jgi:hypothetical protein
MTGVYLASIYRPMSIRKISIAATCLAMVVMASAQEPMLHASAIWSERSGGFNGAGMQIMTYDHVIDGDTMINGMDYYKIRRIGVDSIYSVFDELVSAEPIDQYLAAIREDVQERKWFVVFPSQQSEILLYDFDLAAGDVITGTHGDCSSGPTVVATDQVIINGVPRNRYHIQPWNRYMIEGVGANTGLFGDLCQAFEWGSCLETYMVEGSLFEVNGCTPLSVGLPEITAPSFQIFPNPARDAITFTSFDDVSQPGQIVIRDLAGRQIEQRSFTSPTMIWDLRMMSAGIYMVEHVEGGRMLGTVKLVVE